VRRNLQVHRNPDFNERIVPDTLRADARQHGMPRNILDMDRQSYQGILGIDETWYDHRQSDSMGSCAHGDARTGPRDCVSQWQDRYDHEQWLITTSAPEAGIEAP
jgi:hypothetical protein